MQNQSLINELRAHSIKIQVELNGIEKSYEEEGGLPLVRRSEYAMLLSAKANCLNGIAVLVAANKVAR